MDSTDKLPWQPAHHVFRERATDVISTACRKSSIRAQELCESRGGRPGFPVLNSPYGLCVRKTTLEHSVRAQELCESRGGPPGLPVPNSPYGLRGRKATLEHKRQSAGAVWPVFSVPNMLYCLCVRKAALSSKNSSSLDGHPDLCERGRLIPSQTSTLVVGGFHNGRNCDNTHGTSRQSSIGGGAKQAYPFIPKRCCADHILTIAPCSDNVLTVSRLSLIHISEPTRLA